PKNSAAPARSRPAAAPPTRVFGISRDACENVTIVAVHSAETQDLYEIVRERSAPHLPARAAAPLPEQRGVVGAGSEPRAGAGYPPRAGYSRNRRFPWGGPPGLRGSSRTRAPAVPLRGVERGTRRPVL